MGGGDWGQVLTQTYFTPFGVKALAASTTAHGITSKMLLMGTHTDQARPRKRPAFTNCSIKTAAGPV